MNRIFKYLLLGMICIAFVAGCAKQPTEEVNAAKTAIEAAMAEGAEKYAPEDAKKLNDELTSAMDEIKAQEGKFLKNYDKAKELLAKADSDAAALKTDLPAKKEAAKQSASAAQEAAKAALDEAKGLLLKAPRGKGSKADIEAMKADIKGLEESMPEVQKLIDDEDYFAAAGKANAVKDKAAGVSEQIKQAMEKVGKKK